MKQYGLFWSWAIVQHLKGANLILQNKKKQLIAGVLGVPAEEEHIEEQLDELHTCVEELINCIHEKDISGAKEALKAAVQMCHGGKIEG